VTGLAVLLLLHLVGAADPSAATSPEERVVGSDRKSAALLSEGRRRSPTLRTLAANIDASPWLVFVQEGACPAAETVGCLLHTVGRYGGAPYLRIRLVLRGRSRAQTIATLGHELQHAWEAISDPAVVDAQSLSAMFRRIGHESLHLGATQVFETVDADRVGALVLRELDSENVQGR
jgi:hypothetical protein